MHTQGPAWAQGASECITFQPKPAEIFRHGKWSLAEKCPLLTRCKADHQESTRFRKGRVRAARGEWQPAQPTTACSEWQGASQTVWGQALALLALSFAGCCASPRSCISQGTAATCTCLVSFLEIKVFLSVNWPEWSQVERAWLPI